MSDDLIPQTAGAGLRSGVKDDLSVVELKPATEHIKLGGGEATAQLGVCSLVVLLPLPLHRPCTVVGDLQPEIARSGMVIDVEWHAARKVFAARLRKRALDGAAMRVHGQRVGIRDDASRIRTQTPLENKPQNHRGELRVKVLRCTNRRIYLRLLNHQRCELPLGVVSQDIHNRIASGLSILCSMKGRQVVALLQGVRSATAEDCEPQVQATGSTPPRRCSTSNSLC